MTFLGIDLELSGLHEDSCILTLYMCVLDKNFKICDELSMDLKPEPVNGRSQYLVEPEAMKINGIDLLSHDELAITYKQSKTIIYQWIEKMNAKYGHLTPFGNNIQGDIDKICKFTIAKESWQNHVNRTVIELTSLGASLKSLGKLPLDQSLSIENMAIYFGKKVDRQRLHTANYDVELGAYILKNYLEMMN